MNGNQSLKGGNPFANMKVGETSMSSIVKLYDPPYTTSTDVYAHIKKNIAAWADEACETRGKYN